MDTSDVDFVLKAKKQLRYLRMFTTLGVLIAIAAWLVSFISVRFHDIAQAISSGALLGALLANTDLGMYGAPITRHRLIAALESHANRDAAALVYRGAIKGSG